LPPRPLLDLCLFLGFSIFSFYLQNFKLRIVSEIKSAKISYFASLDEG